MWGERMRACWASTASCRRCSACRRGRRPACKISRCCRRCAVGSVRLFWLARLPTELVAESEGGSLDCLAQRVKLPSSPPPPPPPPTPFFTCRRASTPRGCSQTATRSTTPPSLVGRGGRTLSETAPRDSGSGGACARGTSQPSACRPAAASPHPPLDPVRALQCTGWRGTRAGSSR